MLLDVRKVIRNVGQSHLAKRNVPAAITPTPWRHYTLILLQLWWRCWTIVCMFATVGRSERQQIILRVNIWCFMNIIISHYRIFLSVFRETEGACRFLLFEHCNRGFESHCRFWSDLPGRLWGGSVTIFPVEGDLIYFSIGLCSWRISGQNFQCV
jgi:hypothetical protein